ncbi:MULTISPECIES: hypothetical protein [unclassified Crossiella]|nr:MULTISPECIES: hypothetical protein [unclassified Crossiella]MCK2257518.1 hypothetical protein [Crossiella sp. S99.1]
MAEFFPNRASTSLSFSWAVSAPTLYTLSTTADYADIESRHSVGEVKQ